MTHSESQDLLLDLAYGELDAQRAAEVASHVEACEECRKEKAALEETRRMAAPLRDLEEPSPGFDDRILAAARALGYGREFERRGGIAISIHSANASEISTLISESLRPVRAGT